MQHIFYHVLWHYIVVALLLKCPDSYNLYVLERPCLVDIEALICVCIYRLLTIWLFGVQLLTLAYYISLSTLHMRLYNLDLCRRAFNYIFSIFFVSLVLQ